MSTWSDIVAVNTAAAMSFEATTPTGAPPSGGIQHINAEFLIKYQNSGTPISSNFNVFRAIPMVDSSVSTNFTGSISGFNSQPRHNGTGTVGAMFGVATNVLNMNSGTITTA